MLHAKQARLLLFNTLVSFYSIASKSKNVRRLLLTFDITFPRNRALAHHGQEPKEDEGRSEKVTSI